MDTLLTALQKSPEIPSSTAASEPAEPPSENSDTDDDDEAPETITRATAIESARAADAEAAKAREGLEAAEKRKRRERGRRLEEQARGSKRRRLDVKTVEDEGGEGGEEAAEGVLVPAPEQQEEKVDLNNLPALLPASLLASAPAVRPPSPPLEKGRQDMQLQKQNKHLKFLDAATKPVKDVQRGPVRVRVLEDANPLLPPRKDRGSMGVREKWLLGRQYQEARGKGGKGVGLGVGRVERKGPAGGFLRK